MTILIRDTGGTQRTITAIQVRDAGGTARDISEVYVRNSSNVSKLVFSLNPPMTAAAAPDIISGVAYGSGVVTTDSTTATPTGGTSPYTYLWEVVTYTNASPPTINTDTSATTTLTQTGVTDADGATIKCTVTDDVGLTAETNVVSCFFSNVVPPFP